MPDCHWNAQQIFDQIKAGKKDNAYGMLQSEMNRLSEEAFESLVQDLRTTSRKDDDKGNDVYFKKDAAGHITEVKISDGYLWDTTLARKGVVTPLGITLILNGDCRIE